jgi:hypothetical protein
MKKFCLTAALVASMFCTSTQSMLQILLGAGTTGLGYALYQQTAKDNRLGFAREAGQALAIEAGFGSPIEKLRRTIQKNLSEAVSEQQENESCIERFQRVLRIEKILYCSTALLGAISMLYGFKDFFKK